MRQRFQEGFKLNVGVAWQAASMHLAARDLQGGKQTGGTVTGVVVGHARCQSRPHRQRRLTPVKRLTLRFLIHTAPMPVGRVQIRTDDIRQFAVELQVLAELEGFYLVRLQAVLLPDAMHRGRRQANLLGNRWRSSVCAGWR